MNYYETLGVKKDASLEEIQQAYRKRARECHPDVNPSEDATEQFKKVNEAFEVLNNPAKRSEYDLHGKVGGHGPSVGRYAYDDMMAHMFGFGHNVRRKQGRDIKVDVAIDLQEVLTGCKKDYETPDISSKAAADKFMDELGYFSEKISAAEAFIRISNSLDAPVADGFMAIGEAACQTVTIHASGVASSLYAGHLASKTAAAALKAGDTSRKSLWPYAAAYQTTRGANIAGLEVTRQTIDRLTVQDVNILIESGIMHKEDYIGGVLVNEPAITAASIPDRMDGFLKHPAYIPVLLKMGLTAQQVSKHYRKYPVRYDLQAFSDWRAEKDRLFNSIKE